MFDLVETLFFGEGWEDIVGLHHCCLMQYTVTILSVFVYMDIASCKPDSNQPCRGSILIVRLLRSHPITHHNAAVGVIELVASLVVQLVDPVTSAGECVPPHQLPFPVGGGGPLLACTMVIGTQQCPFAFFSAGIARWNPGASIKDMDDELAL